MDAAEIPGADVVVGIPTYQRVVWLQELVRCVHDQFPRLSVIVADNDPDLSALGALRPEDALRIIAVPHGGLATVRNALLDAAIEGGYRWLALIDDDELPTRSWLQELLRVQHEHGAHVVTGPLTVERPDELTPIGRALRQRPVQPEGPYDGDVLTGNCLVDLDLVRRAGVRFDSRLDYTGGEDTLFFRSLMRAGGHAAYAPGAWVIERQDPSRFTDRGMIRRVFRSGQSSVRVEEALGAGTSSVRRLAALAAVLSRTALLAPAYLLSGRRDAAVEHVLKVVRHAGRFTPMRGEPSRYA